MAKVSIIMPVYNKEKYLAASLEALMSQSFEDWELIIVDDGSKDNCRQIIEYYIEKDSRIIYIKQKNGGVSSARNKGLKKASGEWIWFVDADDLPDTEFLANVFEKDYDDKCFVIVGSYECFKENHVVSQVHIKELGNISSEKLPKLFMKYQYNTGFWGYLWNKLLRREFLEKKQICFKEGLSLAEDLNFLVKIYKENIDIISVPYKAMRYTVDAVNSSKETKIDYKEQLKIQLEIKEWIVDCNNEKEYIQFFRKIISKYVAFCVFYDYEDNGKNIDCAKELVMNDKIRSQLSIDDMKGTMLLIVWCLIHKAYWILEVCLSTRKKIKTIYRGLFKRD